ncbi:helix-turn-helix domain-containing protein [Ramlibacter albus]|uniref:Helix-turn-helix domain-containing protein n=1 Tax=Ramlibacter albus TaxID=2079448 RepID=A0A923MB14_9BURK|nr:helix-turn-helix domain-containing protein [Ramlibacter albus]MBC5766690.1 helix-turn-helix domain-containing protein [Ramlibacter albus]
MSEAAPQPAEAAAPPGPTAGQLMRQAREAAGLHVATLAVALKVPVRKLEALEEDRYDLLPDAVFVRALASSVCRTLKIDAQPVLERLPQVATPRLMHRDDGINAPFRAPGDGPQQAWPEQVSRPVVLTVIALLLGAVVLIFLPSRNEEPVVTTAKPASAPAPAPAAPAPAEPPPAANVAAAPAAMPGVAASGAGPAGATPPPAPVLAPSTNLSVVPAPAAPVAPALPMASSSTPRMAASAAVAAASAAPAASAATGPVSGVVVFRATGESWVKVTDAKGTTVFQKLMTAGESAGASGALPLSVTVGNAKTTTVEVRGQPFDVAPHLQGNVARFEVR